MTGEPADPGELAATPLWWPPTKIAGRYLGPYLAATARPAERGLSAGRPMGGGDPRELHPGHREARELALSFALADANHEDYNSALPWLEVVERLEGVLPPGYPEKRTEWNRRAQA